MIEGERKMNMKLEEALTDIQKCEIPELEDYSILQKIEKEEFFYPSPLRLIEKDDQSRFILFSAPGAVGKTALAKHIAHCYGGLYWNVAMRPLNEIAFAGEISHAVGIGHGARQDVLYQNLRCGKSLFILDAFDEADLISRRDGIQNFLTEVGHIVVGSTSPSIILTARTEMAQFIRDVCKEAGFGITYYDIDYFEEEDSVQFILDYLKFHGYTVGPIQRENIQKYLDEIKQHIGSEQDQKSFIGYAQVLSILARQMEVEIENNPLLNNIVLSSSAEKDGQKIIYNIIQELILREQGKLKHFKETIREKYVIMGKEHIVDSLYCKQEQLIRLQFFVETAAISVDDCSNCNELLPDDSEKYLALLKDWLPQHVFLRNGKIMPIFCDYLLAESLLSPELEMFSDIYQKRLPTRAFMDCYLSLSQNCVNSEHIYYIDLAYSSQAVTGSRAYCDIGLINDDVIETGDNLSLYLTLVDTNLEKESSTSLKIIRGEGTPICLCRAENMSVNVDGRVILSPSFLTNVTIRQSSIECDDLEFNAQEIIFETYGDEENCIIVHHDATKLPNSKIILKGTNKLKVELPEDKIAQYKKYFYEFSPYLYSFSAETRNDGSCDDIEHFSYALKKALEQFRVDKYNSDPAKHREKIDARCHTGCKARVLAFLKDIGFIYEDGIMYKAKLSKMDELKISRVAYTHAKYEQLQYVYSLYQQWFASEKPVSN